MEFKDWFFQQFPEFYQVNDTSIDLQGNGTFKRYLRTFGLELDDKIMPYVNNYVDLWDILRCPEELIPMLSGILGYPPNIGTDQAEYRRLLAWIVAIYKVKGTKKAFQMFLKLFNFDILILALTPAKKIIYDDEPVVRIYDEDTPEIYDSECEMCSGYYIGVDDATYADEDLLAKIEGIVCFLQPINAKFLGFSKILSFEDTYSLPITDDFDTEIITP